MGSAVSLFRNRPNQMGSVDGSPTPLPQSVEDLPTLDRTSTHHTEVSHLAEVSSNVIQTHTTPLQTENSALLAIAVTPRELVSLSHLQSPQQDVQCVPYTPHGDEASIFKYYCPLCMQYYRGVLKMKCCSNYLCVECCKEYAGTKRITLDGLVSFATIEETFMTPNTISCPHCAGSGFHPTGVHFEEMVRDYSSRFVPLHEQATIPGYSPLRIGESFEDLKRKMIPFRNQTQPALVEGIDGTPRSEERVITYQPQSLRRQGSNGIAFSPENGSPRMRLEPDTPDVFPQYVRLDDSKPIPSIALFREDPPSTHASHVANTVPARAEEKTSERGSREEMPELKIAASESERDGIEPSPNETRLGSPSPRFVATLSARSEEKRSPNDNMRNSNTSLSMSGRVTGADVSSAESECVQSMGMNVFVSGVVEQMLRAAVAQHTNAFAVQ